MYRLFETGDLEEIRFCRELREIGCTVHEVDSNGKQWEVVDFGGHFSGHMDGAALGIPDAPKTWHVLEFKTHNKKSYDSLLKKGVEKSKPRHYGQVQAYMGQTGMKRALYLAKNKDNEEIYGERIRFDKPYYDELMKKAERVIFSNEPPPKLSERPDFYICSWCDAKDVCHKSPENAIVPIKELSCKTCVSATPEMDGKARWSCAERNDTIDDHTRAGACVQHVFLPGLLDPILPVDFKVDEHGHKSVTYDIEGGAFSNGAGANDHTSAVLMTLSTRTISHPLVKSVAGQFGASVQAEPSPGYPPMEDHTMPGEDRCGECRAILIDNQAVCPKCGHDNIPF